MLIGEDDGTEEENRDSTTAPKKANKRVHHSLTCDCDDVSITRLVEYINDTWVHDWNPYLILLR